MKAKLAIAGILLGALAVTIPLQRAQTTPSSNRAQAIRLNNLGVAYLNQQKTADALKAFQQAFSLDPELYTARLNQGIAQFNLQSTEVARDLMLEATQRQPNNPRAWYNLALAYRGLGENQLAIEALTRVAAIDPNDPDTQYFLGLTYSQLRQYERAISAFRRALELAPFHASAEFGVAQAFLRSGQTDAARQHMERFQKLTQEKISQPMSLNYGDRGKYSLAEEVRISPGPPRDAIPVRFVPVPDRAGIRLDRGAALPPGNLAPFLGSGACFFDYDADGLPDLFLLGGGADRAGTLYHNVGGRFVDVTAAAKIDVRGRGMGCASGDYDNDGHADLAISLAGRVVLLHNQADGTFRDVSATAGIKAEGLFLGLTFVDYDHDGDLDLYASRFVEFPWTPGQAFHFPLESGKSSNVLWRNNGNATFTDWTAQSGLGGRDPGVAAILTDFNNDRAVDLVATGWSKAPTIYVNPREGAFTALQPWNKPMPAPTAGVVALDFDKDGFTDLAFTHWGSPGLTVWRNVEGKSFEPVQLPAISWDRGWGVAALDYDNDGWIDLAAVGEAGGRGKIVLLRNEGPAGFVDVTRAVGLDSLVLANPRSLVAIDYNRDGATDLLITQNGGAVELLRNEGGNRNSWLRIALKGLADNKSGVGTKIELFAGPSWQKWELPSTAGYLSQGAGEINAGIGAEAAADIIRLLWPTGVPQDELNFAGRKAHTLNEIDRRGSSCPILFTWDGKRYRFICDLMGPATVGHWVAPGERNVPDPTEYVRIEGPQLQPRNGRLSLRLIEPMEELTYLDKVRLLAVDHPSDSEIYPNEYFASAPPFPEFKIITSRNARPPRGAWDDRGRDVLNAIAARDRRYVTGFASLPFPGFAPLHGIELDLGDSDLSKPVRLLLHGFTEYFTATSMFAADQANIHPIPPYVEARTADGRWTRVSDDIGFPAGLARTMTADLTGRLPGGTKRIRIMTNLKVYWDQILIASTSEGLPLRVYEVPLANAGLSFRGFPKLVSGNPRSDIQYDYEDVSRTGPYARHVGNYTRYGDVRDLLIAADDRFVIFGSGDEVALEFEAADLPALPPGWKRDYLLFADGFVKDMDFYAAHAQTVDPLPFHDMRTYPYPADQGYPFDPLHLLYRLDYNTRVISEKGPASYRFRYRSESSR
jgi:tetratricopeptide (TPR) repeat protein